MKKPRKILLVPMLAFGLLVVPMFAGLGTGEVAAQQSPAERVQRTVRNIDPESGNRNLSDQIRIVVNILLFIVGAVSVIMIVIGGLRYVLSGGDSNAVNGAKNTILYAIIGIVVAILAYAIVNFVIGQFV
jgi:hypothetical protein